MSTYDRKDKYYEKAKEEGYRSRAAYKLLELQKKFKIIDYGNTIMDLGAWPGGWLQVGGKLVGGRGRAVGIDLVEMGGFHDDRIITIIGDVRDLEELLPKFESTKDIKAFDVILSDMSPKLCGIREIDQAKSVGCAELAMYVAEKWLKKGGWWVVKVFKGNDTEEFYRSIRKKFEKLHRVELDSTRKTSDEFYLVGKGWI